MLKTTIVIVTYNGMNWINNCLLSCKGYPVIVIDNASTDNTVEYIKKKFTDVSLYRQEKNLGFGQANNLGISLALKEDSDFVFLLNQDAYLEGDTISRLINVYKNNPGYGIISPVHLNGSGTKLDRRFAYYLEYDKNEYFYFDALKNNLSVIYDVSFVNAAAWLLPANTVKNIGGFDPIFFHYGEDDNYCHRVLFHQLKIGVVPEAFVRHDREFRAEVKVDYNSSEYFYRKALSYKVKYANPNIEESETLYLTELKELKALQLRALIKLRFEKFKNYSKLKDVLINAYVLARKSRISNAEKGNHYLDN
ncbi:glycosyltransferase family 2 protein [Algibacter miyuki]|uniref:Glycosyltransferase family 2 protein n=1 Tax=Algibacter miyuki TaxID=1306933 RepID=A0ABV5H1V0_9FLAO|nr:glycosyltransferase family 2 protein [Algibacter miyuki]MDN3666484.1 glycosyltransferase family 2 protein [Algibacter miyuki]